MTNFNERLDEVLAELLWCDKSKAHLVQHYTHRGTNHRAGVNAKQAITSLIKELVAEAQPGTWVDIEDTDDLKWQGYVDGVTDFERNLLKALEEA